MCLEPFDCSTPIPGAANLKHSQNRGGQDDLHDRTAMNPFDKWFTWCQTCRHGGHASHMMQWFSKHKECPVVECTCRCMSQDSDALSFNLGLSPSASDLAKTQGPPSAPEGCPKDSGPKLSPDTSTAQISESTERPEVLQMLEQQRQILAQQYQARDANSAISLLNTILEQIKQQRLQQQHVQQKQQLHQRQRQQQALMMAAKQPQPAYNLYGMDLLWQPEKQAKESKSNGRRTPVKQRPFNNQTITSPTTSSATSTTTTSTDADNTTAETGT